jgi:molybdopterin molybdotransferase
MLTMIPFDEALRIVLASAIYLGDEMVPLDEARGRILARDIVSDIDMPPFDKSAMDGYACRQADLGSALEIVETIPAGRMPSKAIGEGECAKIMTGGVVPEGADSVVMIEHTEIRDGRVVVTKKSNSLNICHRAEDVKAGDVVLHGGTMVTPAETAVLAAVGSVEVPVARRPVVGIITTGSELVPSSRKPSAAQIRDSNSAQLEGQVARAGCVPVPLGIVGDAPEAIGAVIEREWERIDVFLVSGGVSMGEFDHVPDVLKEKGFELLFEKVAMKPGKPTVFGRRGDTFAFGLPGNPVSVFVVFELFVRPFCARLMGASCESLSLEAVLSESVERRASDRIAHIPVRFDGEGRVRAVEYHGSAHIHAYALADGFIAVPAGTSEIGAGETVRVTLTRETRLLREESKTMEERAQRRKGREIVGERDSGA